VHTTCLSETIGDDVNQIVQKARDDGQIPAGRHVMYCNTPSYVGSHITGYSNMLSGFVKYFPQQMGPKRNTINIISGWVEPSDMREIKRIAREMGVRIILLPDTSDVMDAPMTGKHEFYPRGGTTISELVSMGDSRFSIALGPFGAEDAAIKLENKCRVKFDTLELPIGIKASDRFITALSRAGNVAVPDSITDERGRLIDMIADMQKYLYGKRVALFGDPDLLTPLTEFLLTLDMKPVYVVSGTPGKRFDSSMTRLLSQKVPEAKYSNGERADMYLLHQWIKQESVDLLIGNTYGKYIARDENIPFIRMGFPILDRVGHSYFTNLGYTGGMNIVVKILNAILDKSDNEVPEHKIELVM
jgi:nitrogenase molybdenum-iron protein beta chain